MSTAQTGTEPAANPDPAAAKNTATGPPGPEPATGTGPPKSAYTKTEKKVKTCVENVGVDENGNTLYKEAPDTGTAAAASPTIVKNANTATKTANDAETVANDTSVNDVNRLKKIANNLYAAAKAFNKIVTDDKAAEDAVKAAEDAVKAAEDAVKAAKDADAATKLNNTKTALLTAAKALKDAAKAATGSKGGKRRSKKGGKRSSKKFKKSSKRYSRRKSRGKKPQKGGNHLAFSDLKSEQHIPLTFDKSTSVAGSIDSGLFPAVQRIHGGSNLEFSELSAKPLATSGGNGVPFANSANVLSSSVGNVLSSLKGGSNYANNANVLSSSVGNVLSSLKGGIPQLGGSALSYSELNGNASVGSTSFGANALASSSSVANIASSMKGGKKRRGSKGKRGGSSKNQNQRK